MKTIGKLWSVLTSAEKASALGLVCLMLVSMMLEMIGIGVIVPALAAMATGRPTDPSPRAATYLAWIGNVSREHLLLWGLAFLLGLYALKAGFVVFATWQQLRFVAKLQNRIARTMFAAYLSQPWTFHLERNSAEMIRNINDVAPFSITCTAVLGAVAELLVVCGIMALLVWCEPVGAIAVAIMMITATYALDRLTRHWLARWGKIAQRSMSLMFKHLYQGLGGAKDVKVLGCEKEFIEQYAETRYQQVQMQSRQSLFGQLPRLWYELLAVAALCLLTGVMVWQRKPTQAMIPTLGLFAAGAFRMLPSVNRLALAMQSLRYGQASIDTVHSELTLLPVALPTASGRFKFSEVIRLEHVSYRYPTGHENSLDDVSLDIPHGKSVGIIGGSGAGKSTLVDVILGLLSPTAGHVVVDGVNITTNIRGWQDRIGYVPQAIYLCDDTLGRNVAFGVPNEQIDEVAMRRALHAAQLHDFVAELPEGLDTMVGEHGVRLSGGQRQRIGIARALYHDPEVLVLDEATSALDTETEASFMDAVNALHGSKTIIIVAHRLTTIASCDQIYRLDRGRVVKTGTYAEVVST